MREDMWRHAGETPERVAYKMVPSGTEVTWKALEERSRLCAAALIARGFEVGDVIAICMENRAEFLEIAFAAQRAGLYYTPISRALKSSEIEYLLQDSGAKAIFFSPQCAAEVMRISPGRDDGVLRVLVGAGVEGCMNYGELLAEPQADVALPIRPLGADFCYSSGTTGRPKGIKRSLETAAALFESRSEGRLIYRMFDRNTVYLTPAPLYHSAPLRYSLRAISYGGTTVVLEKFDPLLALQTIQREKVTHSQWVPTMFKRMLDLPEEVRTSFDLSSMQYAIHASAPCPVPLKQRMIDWWGPILYEFYAGTEVVGRTSLSSQEWLEHQGSVGLPEFGQVHILNEKGECLGPREVGLVYFSGFTPFAYHNDPDKTRRAYNERGWGTYGDVGYVDEDGYLYLTDRAFALMHGVGPRCPSPAPLQN